ncbi:regulatory protein, luxR family [Chitinophaga ginsengisegetis]|uniref:Regulatory protein, luxR family n=1 Tax=Chitinophaga ginsengisegetis TaxID=393003 RepID=A0A1T5N7X2_9BACT|nr:triple tyrosine motif-containing protein [Chitinophaga ginsengisegetis]SKC96580.1 regulatory protein, luxR family [Chitinophaga ginsengisegetis]
MKHLLLLALLFHGKILLAQNTIGLPAVVNFSKAQYQGNGQTWDIDIDHKGILYFANNEGLLTFNGNYWKLYPVPNNTRLRAVKVAPDGKIYVGAQDDFGYYLPNKNGILEYTSLKKNIPAGQTEFADIWNIAFHNNGVYFKSNNKIFGWRNRQMEVYNAPGEWKIMGSTAHHLYAQDIQQGLLKLVNGQWQPVCVAAKDKSLLITAFLEEKNDTLLVATLKDGLFRIAHQQLIPLQTEADTVFRSSRIYCAIPLDNGQLAVGTFSKGCFMINAVNGKVIQQFSMDEGLQNNNVLRLFADPRHNIWLALDNGIDQLRYNTAIKQILPAKHNSLTTYTAKVFNQHLYIGTSDGLYSTPLDTVTDLSYSKGNFQPVANTRGQVWNLSAIGSHLLMAHQEGTFEITGNKATALLKDLGCWAYLPLPNNILTGCYNGLALIRYNGSQVNVNRHLSGLYESLRFLAVDPQQRIWSSHPYRGVYLLTLKNDTALNYRLFTQKDGLPSTYNNYVFRIQQRMVAATMKGIYEFDEARQQFIPSTGVFTPLKNVAVQYLSEDSSGNIWLVADKKPGVLNPQQQTITWFPELTGKIVGGFEFIYPFNEENIFFGGDKGIYHLNYKKYSRHDAGLSVLLGQIKATSRKDTLLYGGYHTAGPQPPVVLPNAFNSFHFEYTVPPAEQGNHITYSYQLAGFDKQPGEWTAKTEKEYTNLPYGEYIFSVKAKDNLGNISAAASYSFTILPAWYQTYMAKAVYVLLLTGLIWYLYRRQKKKFAAQKDKHLQEQQHLIFQHQLELERNEKQLIQLRNEKLESDVQHKNKELATATMHLVQKGKLISNIREELIQSVKKTNDPEALPSFKKVMRLFEEAENNEEDWAQFSQHFDEVHNNFLRTLKKQYPDLTTTDLKLCAYLRINLTTKEIAQSMGISVRGVETSRYRLRKKLNIPGETGLYDFLTNITQG